MIERLQAALAETEQKLDAWYRTEAQLHAAIHRHGGGDAVRAAIAELAISPIEHNPRLVVETAACQHEWEPVTHYGKPGTGFEMCHKCGADREVVNG